MCRAAAGARLPPRLPRHDRASQSNLFSSARKKLNGGFAEHYGRAAATYLRFERCHPPRPGGLSSPPGVKLKTVLRLPVLCHESKSPSSPMLFTSAAEILSSLSHRSDALSASYHETCPRRQQRCSQLLLSETSQRRLLPTGKPPALENSCAYERYGFPRPYYRY